MLTGIQYEAFLKMNEFTEDIAVVGPYLENDSMIDGFCNAVLFGRSASEEQARELCEMFQESSGN